mgnify:CR=1 FL=1
MKISYICPSFNHSKTIKAFVESVLAQSWSDWELIIIDDKSSDSNIKQLEEYNDYRIKILQNEYNSGINYSINRGASIAEGEYISFVASDDILFKDHAKKTINFLEKHKDLGAVYCKLEVFYHDKELNTNDYRDSWCKDRFIALNKMFFVFNCFPSPGMVFRKNLCRKIFPLNLGLCLRQDYQLHVKILNECNVGFIDDEPLVHYRVSSNNLSSTSKSIWNLRYKFELFDFLDTYLSLSLPILKETFKRELCYLNIVPYGDTIPYVLGRLALLSTDEDMALWGYTKIINFINNENNRKILYSKYNFSYANLLDLTRKYNENKKNLIRNLSLKNKIRFYFFEYLSNKLKSKIKQKFFDFK